MKLALTAITADPACQPRLAMDQRTIDEYAAEMTEGAGFPPLTVFYDGETYWLADGFHRLRAAAKAEIGEIECDVRTGTKRDAVLFSCGANGSHGLRRTNADKRRAVETLLKDDEWVGWSDHRIAAVCAVSNHMVAAVRDSLGKNPSDNTQTKTYTDRWGNTSTMNTSNIGRKAQAEPIPAPTPPPLPAHIPAVVADVLFGDMPDELPETNTEPEPVAWTDDDAAAFARLLAVQTITDRDPVAVARAGMHTTKWDAEMFLQRHQGMWIWLERLLDELYELSDVER